MIGSEHLAIYGLLFVAAFLLVLGLTPISVALAKKIGAIDYPAERKIHSFPIPRLGGLALAAAVWATVLGGCLVNRYLQAGISEVLGVAVGSLIIMALGIYDDVRNASPYLKLSVQVIAAMVAVSLGTRFALASNPLADQLRDYFDLGIFAIPLSVLWIIGLTNAMNLIDGLDGLATGVAMFATMALFLISMDQGAGVVTYFYASIAGATLAFLRFNRHPARVFLGDCGAMFLGFTLACLSIEGTQKSYTLAALFIPLIVFGIPIFESITTLVRRRISRRRFEQADAEHIHHRLIHFGLTQRQAVWILYSLTIILGILAFSFTVLLDEYAAVIVLIIGILGGFLGKELNVFGHRRRGMERQVRHLEAAATEERGP